MIEFTIQYPHTKKQRTGFFKRYGLNSIYAGKHWTQRKADADAWHWSVVHELQRQGIPRRMLCAPVEIVFWWDDRLDIDNHALMGKLTVDALKGYLLQNDSRKYYKRVAHNFWDGGCIKVQIMEIGEQVAACLAQTEVEEGTTDLSDVPCEVKEQILENDRLLRETGTAEHTVKRLEDYTEAELLEELMRRQKCG